MYEKGVKYEEARGEARQGVRMMNLLSSVPTQTTRKPFGTMSALLEAEEDFLHGSWRLSHSSEPLSGGASLTGTDSPPISPSDEFDDVVKTQQLI
ncbi:VAN3-binding protein [Vigna angularis]|uniref:VAN3-binding protein n=1 Tax=Phaseolus angularis TaxID=3914 RepID=A0A8T0JPF1_PHAAN|nr:VAN3-binding protein [Vigna angularis]